MADTKTSDDVESGIRGLSVAAKVVDTTGPILTTTAEDLEGPGSSLGGVAADNKEALKQLSNAGDKTLEVLLLIIILGVQRMGIIISLDVDWPAWIPYYLGWMGALSVDFSAFRFSLSVTADWDNEIMANFVLLWFPVLMLQRSG